MFSTSTSPSASTGTVSSTKAKSSAVGAPEGRDTWWTAAVRALALPEGPAAA